MGRKIPVFVKGGAPKNNTDTSHGISVFSYGIYPTEFFGIDCLIPRKKQFNNKIKQKSIRPNLSDKIFHNLF
jgi:hypothetical protein